jgi:tetratricopeptide (TPR) repeat protein
LIKTSCQSPDKFYIYKGSQEENTSPVAGFVLDVQPAPLIEPDVQLCLALDHSNRFKESVAECNVALGLASNKRERYYVLSDLGTVDTDQRSYDEAEKDFRRAIKLLPEGPEAHYDLGVVFNWERRPQRALDEFTLAAYFKPDFIDAHMAIGQIFADFGDTNRAILEFRTAERLSPETFDVHDARCGFLTRAKLDPSDIIDECKKAIAMQSRGYPRLGKPCSYANMNGNDL